MSRADPSHLASAAPPAAGLGGAVAASGPTLRAFAVLGAGWGSIAALVPELKTAIGADDRLFGSLVALSATGLVLAVLLAPAVDGRLRERAMPAAVLLLGVCFLLPALAGTALAFGLALLALGFASGLTDVIMNVRVSERETATGRSLMNLNHAAFSFAYAGGALVAGAVREAGLPPVVAVACVTALALAVLRRTVQPVPPRVAAADRPRLRPVLGAVACAGGIVLVAFMVENGVELWSALHIERTLGGRAAEGALGPALLGLTMGAGRLAGQGVAERFSEARVVLLAVPVTAAGLLAAAAAPAPWMAYLGFALTGLGVSVMAPMALALIGRRVPPELRGRAIAAAAGMGFLGFFVGPPVIGALSAAAGLRLGIAALAGLILLVPLLLAGLRARR